MTTNSAPTHRPPPQLTDLTCDNCGRPFSARLYWQRFCSAPCRKAWHLNEYHAGKAALRAARNQTPPDEFEGI